jgi:hypothetical protein
MPSDQSGGVGTKEIWSDVDKNSNSGTDKTGAIRYGID